MNAKITGAAAAYASHHSGALAEGYRMSKLGPQIAAYAANFY